MIAHVIEGRLFRKFDIMAAAVVRGIGSNLARNLREVRLHLCQTSAASQGARYNTETVSIV